MSTANTYPNWLGTVPTSAVGATVAVSGVNGQGTQVNTTIQTVPTFQVLASPTTGGITLASLASGVTSSFSTCMLSTGTYWMYADVAASSNTTGWVATDSINFWISDQTSYSASSTTPAWPDLGVRPYYQSFGASGPTTAGQGQTSMTYSGWLVLNSNSVVYNNVRYNGGGTNTNNYYLFNWSYQKMA
jgi:hypothetical protein